jgi:hypothetical protein
MTSTETASIFTAESCRGSVSTQRWRLPCTRFRHSNTSRLRRGSNRSTFEKSKILSAQVAAADHMNIGSHRYRYQLHRASSLPISIPKGAPSGLLRFSHGRRAELRPWAKSRPRTAVRYVSAIGSPAQRDLRFRARQGLSVSLLHTAGASLRGHSRSGLFHALHPLQDRAGDAGIGGVRRHDFRDVAVVLEHRIGRAAARFA